MSENVHPRADELDGMSALELVALIHGEDANAVAAMSPALEDIARAVEAIAGRMRIGGRLHYFGAGTSGLIAAMDAFECPETFGLEEGLVQAHVVTDPGQEDDQALGYARAGTAGLEPADVAVGVSASGNTPYVLGALERAAAERSLRIAVACRPGSALARSADLAIEVDTGPEVIAGSTRLKAGTAQKLVLNMLSTAVFTRLGRTYRGRMVGVVAGNEKRRERGARIIADLAGVPLDEARRLLDESGGDVRAALAGASKP
ncbi:MAG TPA: N-acetylmuramic acid 6-phosphate etherase [Candidatus Limnocylindrales bacterium]|nr:N-acetylmuramic acid 6-phosphate etherase [Candidatus Limnocylindrales bacterium]